VLFLGLQQRHSETTAWHGLDIDKEAVVTDIVNPGVEWRVHYQGTYWTARCVEPPIELRLNERVSVIDRRGLVLLVRPACK